MALRYATYGYILENGRVVMDGEAKALRENEDVKEFYLGVGGGDRKSFRDVQELQAPQALAGLMPRPTLAPCRRECRTSGQLKLTLPSTRASSSAAGSCW